MYFRMRFRISGGNNLSTTPKNPRILLVEDAAVMRKIELKALKSLGFEDILEAKDGDEAILKLESDENINHQ